MFSDRLAAPPQKTRKKKKNALRTQKHESYLDIEPEKPFWHLHPVSNFHWNKWGTMLEHCINIHGVEWDHTKQTPG